MVTEAAGQNSQTGKARTTGHVSGLAFVKVLMMEHLHCKNELRKRQLTKYPIGVYYQRQKNKAKSEEYNGRKESLLLSIGKT